MVSAFDTAGQALPTQVSDVVRYSDGSLRAATVAFRATDVPGLGYRIFYVGPWVPATSDTDLEVSATRVANDIMELDLDTRGICGLRVRTSPKDRPGGSGELIPPGSLATYLVALQGDTGTWIDTRESKATLSLLEKGPVYARYQIRGTTPAFDYTRTITVTAGSPRIDVEEVVQVHGEAYLGHHTPWPDGVPVPGYNESGGWHRDCFCEREKLRAILPVNVCSAQARVWRNTVYVASETTRGDFSASDWVDVGDDVQGLTLINYGNQRCHYESTTNELSLVLGYAGAFLYSNGGYQFMEGT
ncbi:MAG: hypothetical protein ACTSPX_05660, partial [Candidatus Thorarchaeota archaeon]